MLHLETLSTVALDLVRALCSHPAMQTFALAGGTSLALRFGHRISVDLDFFAYERFDNEALTAALKRDFPLDERRRGPTGVTGFITGVKVDLVHYPYGLIHANETCDDIRLVSLPDVVAMKLSAITNRGAKKDFYDLHTLIDQFGLGRLIEHYRTKFPGTDPLMLLRSLTYFADAEEDESPATLIDVTWMDVKRSISKAAQTELAP
jgi:hypothetical protein